MIHEKSGCHSNRYSSWMNSRVYLWYQKNQ